MLLDNCRVGFTKLIVSFLCLLSLYGCTPKGYSVNLRATPVDYPSTIAPLLLANGFLLIEKKPAGRGDMRGDVERYNKPVFEAESWFTRGVDHSLHVDVFYPQGSNDISIKIYSFNYGNSEASRPVFLKLSEEIEQMLRKSEPSAKITKTQSPIGEPLI